MQELYETVAAQEMNTPRLLTALILANTLDKKCNSPFRIRCELGLEYKDAPWSKASTRSGNARTCCRSVEGNGTGEEHVADLDCTGWYEIGPVVGVNGTT